MGTRKLAILGAAVFVLLIVLLAVLIPVRRGDPTKEWIWESDGKRWTRSEGEKPPPVVMPETTTIEVPPGQEQEGDAWRLRYSGKRTERITVREVPRLPPASGHVCSWRMKYDGKRTYREYFCLVDGVEHPYAEMHPPEHVAD